MPSYDSQGRLKIVNAATGSGGNGAIVVASGSTGEIVNSNTTFINFAGPAIESVVVSGSGVTVTTATGSSGGGSGITIASGSSGTIVVSSADFLNFQGNSILSASISGSGATIRLSAAPRVELLEGFTTSDYYTGSNICPGSTSFSAVWFGQVRGTAAGAGQYLLSRYSSGQGWSLAVGGPATGNHGAVFLTSYIRGTGGDAAVTSDWVPVGLLHYALTYDGSTLREYINGNITRFTSPATGFVVSSNPLQLCMTTVWNEPLVQGGFIGAGYIESVLTSQQLQDHLQACKDNDYTFVSNGISWNHYWSIDNPGSSFPDVIQDLTGGTGSLGRVGTAITSTRLRGL